MGAVHPDMTTDSPRRKTCFRGASRRLERHRSMPIEGSDGLVAVVVDNMVEVGVAVAVAGRKADTVPTGRRLWRRPGTRVPYGSDRGIRSRCRWSRDGCWRRWRSDWWRRGGPVESMAVRRRLGKGTRDGDACDSHDLVEVVAGHDRHIQDRDMDLAHNPVADVDNLDLDLVTALARGVGRARHR